MRVSFYFWQRDGNITPNLFKYFVTKTVISLCGAINITFLLLNISKLSNAIMKQINKNISWLSFSDRYHILVVLMSPNTLTLIYRVTTQFICQSIDMIWKEDGYKDHEDVFENGSHSDLMLFEFGLFMKTKQIMIWSWSMICTNMILISKLN